MQVSTSGRREVIYDAHEPASLTVRADVSRRRGRRRKAGWEPRGYYPAQRLPRDRGDTAHKESDVRPRGTIVPFVLASLVVLALAGCGSSGGTATTTATSTTAAGTYGKGPTVAGLPNPLTGLHNARYCEVIPVTREKNVNKAEVFNTIGLNDCPAETWDAITEEAVNKAYGSNQAQLNGPRYWVIGELGASGSSTSGVSYVFNGIQMAKRGALETKLRESTVGSKFYEPNTVHRETVFTYHAGTTSTN
jgi:hypothetical protein